jgi:hypothetical protein
VEKDAMDLFTISGRGKRFLSFGLLEMKSSVSLLEKQGGIKNLRCFAKIGASNHGKSGTLRKNPS